MGGIDIYVYFDNAATSWPKPEEVYTAAENYLRYSGGNPGRSAHSRALMAGRLVYETRERAAAFLGAENTEEIVFTLNATDSLNMAIKGVLESGDHVVYTSLEHNSVLRPLGSLKQRGIITATMVAADKHGVVDASDIEAAVRPETKLIVCTHASNVAGTILPVEEIGKIAREKGVLFLLDAAQTAGACPVNLQEIQPHLAAFTGHKSLLGPPGVGMLYVRTGVKLNPWREGGTGSRSEQELQPDLMPDYLEAGTMNTTGLAGLNEGLKFIELTGINNIKKHEQYLTEMLKKGLSDIEDVRIVGPQDDTATAALVSFFIENVDSGELGYILEEVYGVVSRTGLHCAPQAHRTLGTFPQGTVRFSLSYFNTAQEVEHTLKSIKEISSYLKSK